MKKKLLEILDDASDGIARAAPGMLLVLLMFVVPVLTLGYSTYTFLRFGNWEWVTIGFFVPAFKPTGWIGLDWVLNNVVEKSWIGITSFLVGWVVRWIINEEKRNQ